MVFAVVPILTYMVGYNMLAACNIQNTFSTFSFYNKSTPFVISAVLPTYRGVANGVTGTDFWQD